MIFAFMYKLRSHIFILYDLDSQYLQKINKCLQQHLLVLATKWLYIQLNNIIDHCIMPNATKFNSKWEKLPECQGWLSALKLKNNTYSTERAMCSWCNCDFSITHGGLSDVKRHANSKTHKTFGTAKLTTNSVVACFEKNRDFQNAAKEATQVYHMVRHNESFKSMACTSKLVRFVYDQKQFACSATKSMSIVSGVFEPMILTRAVAMKSQCTQ